MGQNIFDQPTLHSSEKQNLLITSIAHSDLLFKRVPQPWCVEKLQIHEGGRGKILERLSPSYPPAARNPQDTQHIDAGEDTEPLSKQRDFLAPQETNWSNNNKDETFVLGEWSEELLTQRGNKVFVGTQGFHAALVLVVPDP